MPTLEANGHRQKRKLGSNARQVRRSTSVRNAAANGKGGRLRSASALEIRCMSTCTALLMISTRDCRDASAWLAPAGGLATGGEVLYRQLVKNVLLGGPVEPAMPVESGDSHFLISFRRVPRLTMLQSVSTRNHAASSSLVHGLDELSRRGIPTRNPGIAE